MGDRIMGSSSTLLLLNKKKEEEPLVVVPIGKDERTIRRCLIPLAMGVGVSLICLFVYCVCVTVSTSGSSGSSSSSRRGLVVLRKTTTSSELDCMEHRGVYGQWVYDPNYTQHHKYFVRGHEHDGQFKPTSPPWFVPTPEHPFREATAYRWEDDYCPVHVMSLQGFCHLCEKLHIRNVGIIGDSLSGAFSDSFAFLLEKGLDEDADSYNITHNCPNGFDIRQVHLRTNGMTFDQLRNATQNFAQDIPGDTVLIWNHGVHYHSTYFFNEGLNTYLQIFEQRHNDRPNDIFFFRNTVPGHANCTPKQEPYDYNWTNPIDDKPFDNYEQYLPTETDIYDWNLMKEYNALAKATIQNKRLQDFPLYYLNVYNMTVLRKDGHIGGKDCLHYWLPGPIDWWVHMFYSHLLDISKKSRA